MQLKIEGGGGLFRISLVNFTFSLTFDVIPKVYIRFYCTFLIGGIGTFILRNISSEILGQLFCFCPPTKLPKGYKSIITQVDVYTWAPPAARPYTVEHEMFACMTCSRISRGGYLSLRLRGQCQILSTLNGHNFLNNSPIWMI